MRILNPLQMNNWKIKNFLIVVISIQIAFASLSILDELNIKISILRQLVGFVYLTFIPGISILRILKQHKLGSIKTVLYSVSISLSILMFIGLVLNLLSPLFGFLRPLTFLNLFIIINLFTVLLFILTYFIDRGNYKEPFIKLKYIKSNWVLFLLLLPLISILGTHMVNFGNNNIILFLLIPLLSIIPMLVSYNKIPERYYPLTIFIVSLSLIYHTSLISNYIYGWDVHSEYYAANLVIKNSYWHSTSIDQNTNSMLSIVMLGPIYTKLLGIDLTSLIKVIFTFIYTLVPVGLYTLYKGQLKKSDFSENLINKIAFLACFFFISFSFYYLNAPTGWRQEVVELFLVSTLIAIFDPKLKGYARSILLIIFTISMSVSHYGTSYLWILILIPAVAIMVIYSFIKSKKFNYTYILLFVVFSITWYLFVSGIAFETIVNIGNQIGGNIFDLFNPDSSQALNIIVSVQYSMIATLEKFIQIIPQFFITLGTLWVLFTKNKIKMPTLFFILVLLNFAILIAGIAVPYFSSQLSPWRLYHISMIILAPIGILGAMKIIEYFSLFFKKLTPSNSIKLISIFFAIFLLFNTSWVYSLAGDYPHSIRSLSLHQNDIKQGNDKSINSFYSHFYLDKDIYGVTWLSENRNTQIIVYADKARKMTILQSYGSIKDKTSSDYYNSRLYNDTKIEKGYLFLGYPNTKHGLIYDSSQNVGYFNILNLSNQIEKLNLIYSNSGSKIYLGE